MGGEIKKKIYIAYIYIHTKCGIYMLIYIMQNIYIQNNRYKMNVYRIIYTYVYTVYKFVGN